MDKNTIAAVLEDEEILISKKTRLYMGIRLAKLIRQSTSAARSIPAALDTAHKQLFEKPHIETHSGRQSVLKFNSRDMSSVSRGDEVNL